MLSTSRSLFMALLFALWVCSARRSCFAQHRTNASDNTLTVASGHGESEDESDIRGFGNIRSGKLLRLGLRLVRDRREEALLTHYKNVLGDEADGGLVFLVNELLRQFRVEDARRVAHSTGLAERFRLVDRVLHGYVSLAEPYEAGLDVRYSKGTLPDAGLEGAWHSVSLVIRTAKRGCQQEQQRLLVDAVSQAILLNDPALARQQSQYIKPLVVAAACGYCMKGDLASALHCIELPGVDLSPTERNTALKYMSAFLAEEVKSRAKVLPAFEQMRSAEVALLRDSSVTTSKADLLSQLRWASTGLMTDYWYARKMATERIGSGVVDERSLRVLLHTESLHSLAKVLDRAMEIRQDDSILGTVLASPDAARVIDLELLRRALSSPKARIRILASAELLRRQRYSATCLALLTQDASRYDITLQYMALKLLWKSRDILPSPARDKVARVTPDFDESRILQALIAGVSCPSTLQAWDERCANSWLGQQIRSAKAK